MTTASPLFSTVVLLAAGVIGLTVSRYARISPIVGFFIIGAAIGPQALGLIGGDTHTIHFLGELGVCFLLFDIGLHLSLKELRQGWKGLLLTGVLQFICVTAVLTVAAQLLGLTWFAAILVAAIFSLSSTALVLKILSDAKEETSPLGKRATEILVFQDVVAILLLVILAGDLSKGISVSALLLPVLKMILAAVVVIVVGRLFLKPLFRLLISVKNDEVITAFSLLLVFLTSWATESLGLSLALGAFLGGLALSESSYSYLVRGEVAPFRALLLSLFFLSVGISLDLQSITDNFAILISLLGILLIGKIGANFVAFRLAKIERSLATLLAFLLGQGSEFGFVLLGLAYTAGVLDAQSLSLCVTLVGFSLAVTPVVAAIGCMSSRSVCRVDHDQDAETDDPREIIIVRIDDFGRQLAGLLEAERIPYRAHDQDLERLAYAKSRGLNVYFSDLKRPRTLGRVSVGKALAIVSLVEDDAILTALVHGIKKIDSSMPIVAATENPVLLEKLNDLGVEHVYIKNDSTIIAVFENILRQIGFDDQKIEESVARALRLLEPEDLFPHFGNLEPEVAESMAA